MKNLKTACLLLLFVLPALNLAQEVYTTEYEIQYSLEYSIFGEDLDNKQTEVLYLFTSPETSVFMNQNTAKEEEINENIQRIMKSGNIDMAKAGKTTTDFHIQIYKNLPDERTIVKEEIASKDYVYQEGQVPLEWNITHDSKEYSVYSVQKATTSFAGRDYEAWFTMEIPIPDGPYIFAGLPGLIVELYDTEKHYHFSLLSVQKMDNPKDWELGKIEEVSKEVYKKIKTKASKGQSKLEAFLSQNPNATIKITDKNGREVSSTEHARNNRKIKESKNNPIELE